MSRLPRLTAVLFCLLALAGLAALWAADFLQDWRLTPLHQRGGAAALILIGASYVALQLGGTRQRGDRLKGIFLGAAFILWGGEQFLPPGRAVTVVDGLVVTIFVVDLSLIIIGEVRRRN